MNGVTKHEVNTREYPIVPSRDKRKSQFVTSTEVLQSSSKRLMQKAIVNWQRLSLLFGIEYE